MLSLMNNFLELQLAFFKAALYQTYLALGLEEKLKKPRDYISLAAEYGFKPDAMRRYLNAAASIGLVERVTENDYRDLPEKPSYSDDGALILFWLIKNGIPDLIENGINTVAAINAKIGADAIAKFNKAFEFNLIDKESDGSYKNHEVLKPYLLSNSKSYIGPKITHYEHVMYPMWSVKGIIGALKTGRSQWREIFGAAVSTQFEIYREHPTLLEDFTNGLHYLNQADNSILASQLTLDAHCMLDVGGGSGAWALAFLEHGTVNTRVDIYELPEAISLMSAILSRHTKANEHRVSFIAGSFFDKREHPYLSGLPESKQYDSITLGWILHDWNDETCLRLLRKVKSHLKPDGQLIVLESILPPDRISLTCIADISMLLQTEGCERTLEEYKTLLVKAGFNEVEYMPTSTRRQMIKAKV
jgi:ubiquinone/menaquinone biosynthesis C-methylase UbiE